MNTLLAHRARIAAGLMVGLLWTLVGCAPAPGVEIIRGPTPIPGGDARHSGDLSLGTPSFTLSFALKSEPPWGVAPGGLVDIGIRRQGALQPDFVSLVDFLPNGWQAGSTVTAEPELIRVSADEVRLVTRRSWQGAEFTTEFAVRADIDEVAIETTVHNPTSEVLSDMSSGYALWPDGGYVHGLGDLEGIEEGRRLETNASWSAFYDSDWLLALHADFDDHFLNFARDRLRQYSLQPGETRRFQARLQIGRDGDLSPVLRTLAQAAPEGVASVTGQILASDLSSPEDGVIVVEAITPAGAQRLGWARARAGVFDFQLAAGRYRLSAAAPNHAPSTPVEIILAAGERRSLSFTDLAPPAELVLRVRETDTRQPLDTRIQVLNGPHPAVGFFGQRVWFTELDQQGDLTLALAPGDYLLALSSGGGFTSAPVQTALSLGGDERRELTVLIDELIDPNHRGWYAADLHHHSDVLDGYTPPQFVLQSQLAAGLDFSFLSDHDATVNNAPLAKLSAQRSLPFIAGTELSPSWAHFNAYPIDTEATVTIAVNRSSAAEIFAEARRMGAAIVQINHPFIDYGYFRSRDAGVIPGGFSEAFDVVEISSTYPNEQTIPEVWRLWNAGQRAYFSAGSDAHDVWQEISGAVRTFARVEPPLSVTSYIDAVRRGHSYASAGPLIFPEIPFGSELEVETGTPLQLTFDLASVAGLARVSLIERGQTMDTRELAGVSAAQDLSFWVTPEGPTWVSLVVEDVEGHLALSNPWWLTPSNH